MKNFIGLPILAALGLVFIFSTGAAFIDKETKKNVEELNYRFEKLIQLDHERHQELMRVLKEIRELSAKKIAPAPIIVEASPAAAPPAVMSPPETAPVAVNPPPAITPSVMIAPLPIIPMTILGKVTEQKHQSDSFALLALILAGVSLVSMGFMIAAVRKSDERLRRMVWKSEVDHLRDEVMGGRPHLKIEKSYDLLTLTNTGSVAADEIRLSLGPAPATMKQRLKVLARIGAGEKVEVEIGPQATGGQIYGTLEYKNPDGGRIYKDQFVLKVDGVTGELIPIQQAS